MSRRVSVMLVAVTLLGGGVSAQVTGSGYPPETAAAVKAVVLTAPKAMSLIKAMEELTAYVIGSPETAKAQAASLRKPFNERVAMLAADPKATAILKSHGFTATDYSVSLLALRAAAWASGGGRGGLADLASPVNVTLFKSNRELQDAFSKAEQGRAASPK
jgi:hypothetical protein